MAGKMKVCPVCKKSKEDVKLRSSTNSHKTVTRFMCLECVTNPPKKSTFLLRGEFDYDF